MALDNIVPESFNWLHTDEGPECVLLSNRSPNGILVFDTSAMRRSDS